MKVKPLFDGILFVLDLGLTSYKEKKKLRETITSHGGTISYILTKTSNYVIVPVNKDISADSYKTRKAQQLKIPVVSFEFVNVCVKENHIVDIDQFCVAGSTKNDHFKKGKVQVESWTKSVKAPKAVRKITEAQIKALVSKKFSSGDKQCPKFSKNYHVPKFVLMQGKLEVKSCTDVLVSVVELHIAINEDGQVSPPKSDLPRFRVLEETCVLEHGDGTALLKQSYVWFFKSGGEARYTLQHIVEEKKCKQKMEIIRQMPHVKLGSPKLRHMIQTMGISSGILPANVARLVFSVCAVAFRELSASFTPEVLSSVTPDKINKAVVLLMKIKDNLKNGKSSPELSRQFNSVLSLKRNWGSIDDMKALSKRQDFIQLVKDILLATEVLPEAKAMMSNVSNLQFVVAFYKMLKCSICCLDAEEEEYRLVKDLLLPPSSKSLPAGIKVRNVYCVHRDVEVADFTASLTSKLLLHASDAQNFVGILSRGLLLPLIAVSEHGADRSDVGMLGNALYFSDDIRKAIQYSKLNPVSGSRLLLVNEVALGNCHSTNRFMPSLTGPPDGFDSVCGVASNKNNDSDFDFNEYAIFKVQQQRIRYLVEFTLEGDAFIESAQIAPLPICDVKPDDVEEGSATYDNDKISLDDLEKLKNLPDQVKAGLLIKIKGKDQQLPLEEVHVRAKMMDMVAEVVVMQAYCNRASNALEAKYVFPLEDSVAVCGFEAFINGKHVIGKVKEKEAAHKEYREAIDAGHGAYLMDQEKPDVFTVSVGNLPPLAIVLIKITYVSELPVVPADDGSSDSILFFLPGSVAAAVKRQALLSGQVTQTKVNQVTASGLNLKKTSLMITVEMPFDIRKIESPTHKIFVKRTAAKACVRLAKNERVGDVGFKLLVSLAEIHVPRMWVEQHPIDEESQACMLAFYPEFDSEPVVEYNAVILLDMSLSMRLKPAENLEKNVKKIALMILKHLPTSCSVNVIKFGSGYQELFLFERKIAENIVRTQAEEFVQSCTASLGASEAWRPLCSLNLLQKSFSDESLTNLFLLSDGHLTEENRLLQISRSLGEKGNKNATRIFSFSVGESANQHLLRSMSYASGGTHEHFSSDSKSKWETKVKNQLKKAEQPMLKNIRIEWKRYDDAAEDKNETNLPIQAPANIKCLYNASRLVVYGYIPYCTQAELRATVCGKEISTVVSTSQLSITKGKTLHRLTARAMIKDYEEGMYDIEPLQRDQLKVSRKSFIISLSCEHDVVSPYTSFVAVEERKKDENVASNAGPTVNELVETAFVDVIPEIQWDQEALFEEMPDLKRAKKEIEQATHSYHSSVMECRRHFDTAEEIMRSLSYIEKTEAQVIMASEKLKLSMDAKLPDIDEHFEKYFVKVLEKDDTFNSLLSIILTSDLSKWKGKFSQSVILDLEKSLNESLRKLSICEGDPRHTNIMNWWQYVTIPNRDIIKYSRTARKSSHRPMSASVQFSRKKCYQKMSDPSAPNALYAARSLDRSSHQNNASKLVDGSVPPPLPLSIQFKSAKAISGVTSSLTKAAPPPSATDGTLFGSNMTFTSAADLNDEAIEETYDDAIVETSMMFSSKSMLLEQNLKRRKSKKLNRSIFPSPAESALPPPPLHRSVAPPPPIHRSAARLPPPPGSAPLVSFQATSALSFPLPDESSRMLASNSFATESKSLAYDMIEQSATHSSPASWNFEFFGSRNNHAQELSVTDGTLFGSSMPLVSAGYQKMSDPSPPNALHAGLSLDRSSHQNTASKLAYGSVPPPVPLSIGFKSANAMSGVTSSLKKVAPPPSFTDGTLFGSSMPLASADLNDEAIEETYDDVIVETSMMPSSKSKVLLEQNRKGRKLRRKNRSRRLSPLPAESPLPSPPLPRSVARPPPPVASVAPPPPPPRSVAPPPPIQRNAAPPLPPPGSAPLVSFHAESALPPPPPDESSRMLASNSLANESKSLPYDMIEESACCSSPTSSNFGLFGSRNNHAQEPSVTDDTLFGSSMPLACLDVENCMWDDSGLCEEAEDDIYEDHCQFNRGLGKNSLIKFTMRRNSSPSEEVSCFRGGINSSTACFRDFSAFQHQHHCSGFPSATQHHLFSPAYTKSHMPNTFLLPFDDSETTSVPDSLASESEMEYDKSGEVLVQGFDYIFSTLGDKLVKKFCSELLQLDPSKEISCSDLLELEVDDQGDDILKRIAFYFVKMVKATGALSLGKQVFPIVVRMLLVAFVVEFCWQYNKSSPSICIDWLKKKDKEYPLLYTRLDLGKSWGDAAVNLVNKVIAASKIYKLAPKILREKLAEEFS